MSSIDFSKPPVVINAYELYVLKDNFTGEIFDNAAWFTCPLCDEDSLARFNGDVTFDEPLRARCCKTRYLVNIPEQLKV